VRRTVWRIRIAFVLVSAALLVAAVQARRHSEETGGGDVGRLVGVTGQRQEISFRVDEDGRPQALATLLWAQCPGVREQRTAWTPADGVPVAFVWHGDWLRVREDKSFTYANGVHGFASATMNAHPKGKSIDGFMRSRWRFERHGREYMACDSGYVPFAAGSDAESRLSRLARVREPVTLYPIAPEGRRPGSFAQFRFVWDVDDTCISTYRALRDTLRSARRQAGGHWRVERAYVRGHAAQLAALRRLGQPPEARDTYLRWIRNFDRRVALERRQLSLLRWYYLDKAAALQARIATLKARGNASGLAFGLRSCTSNGPTGAPKS
jgi:hypothetical protein